MTEQELRALVRDAIASYGAGPAPIGHAAGAPGAPVPFAAIRQHASHALFTVPSGADTDGPCVIEPAVPCTHCGYCKSYGH